LIAAGVREGLRDGGALEAVEDFAREGCDRGARGAVDEGGGIFGNTRSVAVL
jgi:hypothetical protein